MKNLRELLPTSEKRLALLTALEREQASRAMQNRLTAYGPYPKQAAFHAAGAAHRERLFLAGNQLGKTLAGGNELAFHLSGSYPAWWKGRRWDRPIVAWAAGVTAESTRDNPQRMLMGRPGRWGTGSIPANVLGRVSRAAGIRDLIDTIRVKHASGGESVLSFKFYEKGREKWQGETLDLVWFDEEPPVEIYSEGLARTNATSGMVYLTCTPLLGMTEVVGRFLHGTSSDRHLTQMGIEEAGHYTAEQREKIIAGYLPHEREARAKGIPMLGSGRIFPVPEESITVDSFRVPRHWPRLGGMDFGWDHPFAAVKLAWDRDADCVYVTDAYRVREATPVMHAAALKPWGASLTWAWPADGLQHSKDSGKPLAEQYRRQGLKLLPQHARYPDNPDGTSGTSGVEAGLMDMLDRMQSGRFKVFRGRIQGRYASTGSGNAYVLTPDVALAAYVTGERHSFRANFANTGSATLNISALGGRTLKKMTLSGKANLSPGDIQAGQPVTVEFDGTDMIMVTPAGTTSYDAAPTGMIAPFAGAAVPNGWLLCDGAAVSRTTYAALFAVISTTYGAGDGTTSFNLPDLRGRVALGRDDMGGTAANRAQLTTTLSTTNGSNTATAATASNLSTGMVIISTNVPAGAVVTAISGTTITMSANATATAADIAARFSLLTDAQSLGGNGGAQTHALVTAQMPPHTHTYNDWNSAGVGTVSAGGNFGLGNSTGVTGGGQSHPNMQPSLVLNYGIKT